MRVRNIVTLIILFVLVVWIISDIFRAKRIHEEIDQHGVLIPGVIVEIKVLENTASILCRYIYNSKEYQTWLSEITCMGKVNAGDAVLLEVSSLKPKRARFSLKNCDR